jgi:uncharacterized membrane protein YsdA (DUF1294 family)
MTLQDFMPSQMLWTLTGTVMTVSVIMSMIAYQAFAYDKSQAQTRGSRVPEATLLYLAIFGGWPGAKLAQRRFRHKTRKEPFRTLLNAVGALQGGVFALLLLMPGQRIGDTIDRALQPMIASASGPTHEQVQQASQNPMPRRFGPGSTDW